MESILPMAFTQNAKPAAARTEKKEADGWLNLRVTDKQGKEHNIPCYIPLDKEKRVHAALLEKALRGEPEITIKGTIVVTDKDETPLEF